MGRIQFNLHHFTHQQTTTALSTIPSCRRAQKMHGIGGGILILLIVSTLRQAGCSIAHEGSTAEMVPLVEPGTVEMVFMLNETRRKLGSFQICSLCTCCGGGSSRYCLASPCCYAINCNIPNRPFGFCSFTPKTCNCFTCHL